MSNIADSNSCAPFFLPTNFFVSNFERRALVLPGPHSQLRPAQITLDELAFLIELTGKNGLHHTHVYGGKSIELQAVHAKAEGEFGGVTFSSEPFHQQFQDHGATIIQGQLQKFHYGIAKALDQFVNAYVENGRITVRFAKATAYLTPEKRASFPLHHDNHDVFIIQTEGCKFWQIYEPVFEFPVGSQKLDRNITSDPYLTVHLCPGDVLYIPRGHPHVASTGDELSLHVTFGLYTFNWIDLIESMLRNVPEARASLPFGFIEDIQRSQEDPSKDNWRDHIRKILDSFNAQVNTHDSAPEFIRTAIEARRAISTRGNLKFNTESTKTWGADPMFRRRWNTPVVLREFTKYAVIVSSGARYTIAKEGYEIWKLALNSDEFHLSHFGGASAIATAKPIIINLIKDGVFEFNE